LEHKEQRVSFFYVGNPTSSLLLFHRGWDWYRWYIRLKARASGHTIIEFSYIELSTSVVGVC
jgi:hypothetical protein